MKVSDIHTCGAIHIPMSCTLQDAAVQMRDQHVGALIVTGGPLERIAGIVTDRDIVLNAVALGLPPNDMLVTDIMTNNVVSIDAGADIAEAMETMAINGVRRLATTNDGDDIIGVLSLDDVVEALGRDLSLLASIIRCGKTRESSVSDHTALDA
jgi:signal-transduction protein with cAMP-binding, CBS, and nucleotidyltransferase domain